MVTVKYDDLSTAFDFVCFAALTEHRAFLSLDTGVIYWVSETNPIDEEDLPDDLETSDRYIEVPHKNDLGLGNRLAMQSVEGYLLHHRGTVEEFFRHRGAYARFKALLVAERCLEQWYAFEVEATERALREWCEVNQVRLEEDGRQESA